MNMSTLNIRLIKILKKIIDFAANMILNTFGYIGFFIINPKVPNIEAL